MSIALYGAKFDRFARIARPDVIHYPWHGRQLNILGWMRERGRMPLVCTVHSLRTTPPDDAHLPEVLASLEVADEIIAVSSPLRDAMVSFGIPAEKITVIPNGVDPTEFFPGDRADACARLHLDPKARHILCVAKLRYIKGTDVLLQAFARLARVEPDAHLHLIGTPDLAMERHWWDHLRTLSAQLGIEYRVHWVGGVDPTHTSVLRDWYQACDVFAMPSRSEGMGIVFLEAMACAKPVVGTAVGGIPTVIEQRHNGLLVPSEDPDALAAALKTILGDASLSAAMGAAGLARVRAEFSWEDIVRKTTAVYSRASTERRKS